MASVHTYRERFEAWLNAPNLPENLRLELESIRDDEKSIQDRFYLDLEFGTGGLRGILGAGTNRMNVYTVRRATLGLARYILAEGNDAQNRGVVIGYDCRRMSREFAEEVGLVLAAAGVKAYVFEHLCPTPELSFAVRHLGAAGGVMITASHNPPEYNGYKVYGPDGGQILPDVAEQVMAHIAEIEDVFRIDIADKAQAIADGRFVFVGEAIDELYYRRVVETMSMKSLSAADRARLRVVYTPLHGTGNIPVQRALSDAGYTDLHIVESQEAPDGEFPTVKSPNPEEHAAFEKAIDLSRALVADIALGTDPDADRVGVAVRDRDGEYVLLTGNQTGGLLVDFYLSQLAAAGALPENAVVFKTIVTSELGAEVARTYGVASEDTLTGFKYIGERIKHYETTGEKQFVFGYEESYGYLASPFVRDKDAVQICLLIAEMAAYYKRQGLTLLDALERLYEKVGYFEEKLISVTLPGVDGLAKIGQMMVDLRENGMTVDHLSLSAVEDYLTRVKTFVESGQTEALLLPQADVLKYVFEGGAWMAIRPSGTEPKIKVYLGGRGSSKIQCTAALKHMQRAADAYLAKWRG
jgi:phosphoglucomutase